jgi:Flp pilus assembly protein TadG
VELVITMPALLLLVLLIMQFGIWAHAQHVALAAARDGAEAARAYGASEAAGHDRVATSLDRLGPTILRDPRIEVTRTAQEVTVTVTAHAPSILGGLLTFGVKEQARGPVERFIPIADGATP